MGLAYFLGWHLTGWYLLVASVGAAALMCALHFYRIIPARRWPDLSHLSSEEKSEVLVPAMRTSFLYGILYFFLIGLFAGYLKSYLGL